MVQLWLGWGFDNIENQTIGTVRPDANPSYSMGAVKLEINCVELQKKLLLPLLEDADNVCRTRNY